MKDTKNLYELTEEYENIDQLLEEDGDVEQKITDITEKLLKKVEGCLGYGEYLKDTEELIASKIKRLTNIKKSIKNKRIRFRENVKRVMLLRKMVKLPCDIGHISLSKNEKIKWDIDMDALPQEYKNVDAKLVISANYKKIEGSIEAGHFIDGVKYEMEKSINFYRKRGAKNNVNRP